MAISMREILTESLGFKDYLAAPAGMGSAGKLKIQMSNLTQVVNVDKNLKTLKKTVHASDIDQLLSSKGPYLFCSVRYRFSKIRQRLIGKIIRTSKPPTTCGSFKQSYCKWENRL